MGFNLTMGVNASDGPEVVRRGGVGRGGCASGKRFDAAVLICASACWSSSTSWVLVVMVARRLPM